MSKLILSNSTEGILSILLEPLGSVTTLLPRQACLLVPIDPAPSFHWSIVWRTGGWLAAYAEGDCREIAVEIVKHAEY